MVLDGQGSQTDKGLGRIFSNIIHSKFFKTYSNHYRNSFINKTKEDFSPKRGLGQQDIKALLAVEK